MGGQSSLELWSEGLRDSESGRLATRNEFAGLGAARLHSWAARADITEQPLLRGTSSLRPQRNVTTRSLLVGTLLDLIPLMIIAAAAVGALFYLVLTGQPPKLAAVERVTRDGSAAHTLASDPVPTGEAIPSAPPETQRMRTGAAGDRLKPAAPPQKEPALAVPVVEAPASPPVTGPPRAEPASPAASPVPNTGSQSPAEDVAALVRRGHDFLGAGDITAARLFYERAAAAGSGLGALWLGMTFDPDFLKPLGLQHIQGDVNTALSWYRRARSLGEVEADQWIKSLQKEQKKQ
jgi:hypothetical protein